MVRAAPTISIVDDDGVVREATADLVSSLGYHTRTFASGEAFLEAGKLEQTSCLITDFQMPGLDGLQLQSRLLEEGHRIPVIFITAHESAMRPRLLHQGAVECLAKPFTDTALLDALNAAIPE